MDRYRDRLKHAQWTWLEHRHCSAFMSKLRRKDRTSGRAEKRAARRLDRAELQREAIEAKDNAQWDAAWIGAGTCDCSDCQAEYARAAWPVGPAHAPEVRP